VLARLCGWEESDKDDWLPPAGTPALVESDASFVGAVVAPLAAFGAVPGFNAPLGKLLARCCKRDSDDRMDEES
jgi:hypothetical protein